MRVLNQMFIIGVLTLFVNFSFGQNTVNKCKVVNKDFEGQYLGECKKGLANGKGSLIFGGGQFVYKGSFKNGKMHGKGEMFMVTIGISKSFKKALGLKMFFQKI